MARSSNAFGPGGEEHLYLRQLEDGTVRPRPQTPAYPAITSACRYTDLPLGIVDASVVALSERRRLDTFATLDHRYFVTIKPRRIDAFTLVPFAPLTRHNEKADDRRRRP